MGAPWIQLVADYFWIQTIQAIGIAQTVKEHRDIYDYASLLTDLDPKFRQPYVFAGVAMVLHLGQGRHANVEESTRLMEKGLPQFPDYVMLRIMLGYNYSAYLKDYRRAGLLLQATAKLPGAPPHIGPLATRMLAQAGDFDAALEFASTVAESAEDPEVREVFVRRVAELQLEKVLNAVDVAVGQFKQQSERFPKDVQELIGAGLLAGEPVDPFGGQIVLGPDGRAHSTKQKRRLTDFAREE